MKFFFSSDVSHAEAHISFYGILSSSLDVSSPKDSIFQRHVFKHKSPAC